MLTGEPMRARTREHLAPSPLHPDEMPGFGPPEADRAAVTTAAGTDRRTVPGARSSDFPSQAASTP